MTCDKKTFSSFCIRAIWIDKKRVSYAGDLGKRKNFYFCCLESVAELSSLLTCLKAIMFWHEWAVNYSVTPATPPNNNSSTTIPNTIPPRPPQLKYRTGKLGGKKKKKKKIDEAREKLWKCTNFSSSIAFSLFLPFCLFWCTLPQKYPPDFEIFIFLYYIFFWNLFSFGLSFNCVRMKENKRIFLMFFFFPLWHYFTWNKESEKKIVRNIFSLIAKK